MKARVSPSCNLLCLRSAKTQEIVHKGQNKICSTMDTDNRVALPVPFCLLVATSHVLQGNKNKT